MGKKAWRLLNRDGSFNIAYSRWDFVQFRDLYHSLLSISWLQFFVLTGASYFVVNLIFASFYYFVGPEGIEGIRERQGFGFFVECFFFSVQTLATIGYGRMSPAGLLTNFLVMLEAFSGVLSLALTTGLLYARFARPTARVVFSKLGVIAMHDGVLSFVFRIANERLNQIAEARVHVTLVKNEVTQEGDRYRNLYDLKLERGDSPLFALTWTVVHSIDASSPLHGMDRKALTDAETEILVVLTGFDDTFSQNIHARFSYTTDDIVWNGRFVDVLKRGEDGKIRVDMARIHDVEAV